MPYSNAMQLLMAFPNRIAATGGPTHADQLKSNEESTVQTYVASIGGQAVMAFRAEDDDQARAIVDDPDGSMRSDLRVLAGSDGKPLWDGKSAIAVQEATAEQHAEWEQSRDQAITDGEIDLDAGSDPDEWNVYLIDTPRRLQPSSRC